MPESVQHAAQVAKAAESPDQVEVRIRGLMMDPVTNMPMIVLKDVQGEGVLPIWVGIFEANAIALEIEKTATPRPMTHDLLRDMLRGFDVSVTSVLISELRDDTFFAIIRMSRNGEMVTIDARPSDALALAMRCDCPIFVHRTVMEHARLASNSNPSANPDELRRWLEGLNDDDMGRYKM